MPGIVVHYPDGRTEQQPLASGSYTIGREPGCEIVIGDQSISRRHARVVEGDFGDHFIEDHESKNGTYVNGRRISRHRLRDRDRVTLGAVDLIYRTQGVGDAHVTQVVLADPPSTLNAASFASSSRQLVLSQQRLELLYGLSERLTRLRNRNELLEDVMDICFETLRFERGLIALKPQRGSDPEWPVVRNLQADGSGRLTISRSLVNRAMDHGERCIINDPAIDMVDPTMSMAEYHIRSAMCVPILYRDEILGVIYGDRVRTSTTYQQDDVDFLAGLARQLSVGLVNARLLAEHEEKLHLENEIALARRIQTDLYPHEPLDTETVYVTGTNRPGRQVSGDYFDVVPLDDGRIAVVMADVVGKGVAAALLTANLQAAVRVTLPLGLTLPEMVERWNRLIHANTDVTKFITALIGILDPARNRFEYVAAGHFPPFLIEPGGAVRELPVERGLPLGIDPTEIYVAKTAEIPPRAMLFLYTDGVTEALCTDDTLYGSDRFVAVLQRHAGAEPAALVAAVEQSVADFVGDAPQSDDITLMVIQNK